jgi:pro-kumamolisin-like protein/subtilase family protein
MENPEPNPASNGTVNGIVFLRHGSWPGRNDLLFQRSEGTVNRTVVGCPRVQKRILQADSGLLDSRGHVNVFAQQHKCHRLNGLLACALLLVMPGLVAAQNVVAQPRIAAQVEDGRLAVVRGNVHPLARPQYDQGKADPSFKLERITMMFRPTAAQQADLDALLAAQQNPPSPNFHQWLTPEQYADRFGIAQSDLNKITAWLQAQGFDIVEIPRSRNWIVFDGTAAQVEFALHSEVHNYTANGKKFYANSAEPSVPAALANVVLGFHGLHNFPVKPRGLKSIGSSIQPNFTSSVSGKYYLSPGDFATIYDLGPLYTATPAIDGTGQKIAIVGQSNIVLADITKFRSLSGLPANVPQLILVTGSSDPGIVDGDVQEASLDIEWAGAVAKNATIIFVYSTNAFASLAYAIQQNLAPVISVSYGSCEPTFSTSDIDGLVAMAQQANAQGITIVSATGDGGATDCDGDLGNYPAILGLNVDVPASLPYVTGVGGTEFNEAGLTTYWQPQGSSDIISSATQYIPEMVWNDSQSLGTLASGGGGASSIFGKPSWQTGTGVPSDGARDVPDISLNASTAHDPYLVCTQIQATPGAALTSSCQNGFRISTANTNLTAFGGTSFGAPTFAGIVALINQKTGSTGQGNINYILYPLASSLPAAFHDITTGDNTSPCTSGTESCPNGSPIGFTATTGYDQATGLGSIDVTNLVNAWPAGPSGVTTPTLTSINPTSIGAGSGSFTLTATGSSFDATKGQIHWNGSTAGVTMLPGGTPTSIKATISANLVLYGTTASITVTDDAAKAGESSTPQNFFSTAQPFTVNALAPPNDNIDNAIAVTIGSISTVDNSAATTDPRDPTITCAANSTNPRTKTVWWSLTAASSGSVSLSTIGSVYDTTLSVWTGSPTSLAEVACNDDVSRGQYRQSLLSFAAMVGTKYYIMVAPFGPPDSLADQAGGKTVLNVSNANLSSLTASPNSQTVSAGSPATFTITDLGAVSYALTCTGLPTGAACPAVNVSANSTASLVITTTPRTSAVPPLQPKGRIRLDPWPEILTILGISMFALIAVRRRRILALAPVSVFALLLVFLAVGCGKSGGNTGGGTNPNGTPAGSYTITVTGTSGATTQVITVTLTVT